MPTFLPQSLRDFGYQLFTASGFSQDHARQVVDHLVQSSLFGHDSNGVLRLYEYLNHVEDGHWDPQAEEPRDLRSVPALRW